MRNINDILKLIKYPLLTEKSLKLIKLNIYTFIIDNILTKTEIKYFFKIFFNIKIIKLNTLNLSIKKKKIENKIGKKTQYKKIYIKLNNSFSFNSFIKQHLWT
jgi:large subunit ribosomal protein L23